MNSFVAELMTFLIIPSCVSLAKLLVESYDSVPTVSSLINLFYIANAWHQMRVYHLVKMQIEIDSYNEYNKIQNEETYATYKSTETDLKALTLTTLETH